MSFSKLGFILFSGFLIFATAPLAPAQSSYGTNRQTTAQKGNTTKDTGKTTEAQSKEKVRQTQTALKKEGFDPGPVDGIMGVMTMTALRNYQSHNGLEVTGTVTAETESALMGKSAGMNRQGSLNGEQNSNLNGNNPTSSDQTYKYNSDLSQNQSTSTREALGLSSEGAVSDIEEVRQVQQALADLEYNPGEVNGMMSSETQQAIRAFQWLNDLPVTGSIDGQTKIAIDSQWRGGTETAQLSTTTSSADLGREKPAVAEEQAPARTESSTADNSSTYLSSKPETSSDLGREKPSPAEEQTQSRSQSSKTSDASAKDYNKDKDTKVSKSNKDASERISKATDVLQDLTASADKKVPNELLERAEAIAVIPNMMKGAFGIGGRYGKGVVSQRDANGRWSAPSFLEIGGGSFGAQIGVSSTDLVLVFTDRKALDLLEGGKDLKLGVDAGIVAGPIGRTAEAGVNANLKSAIYAYSRAKGLFAGVALDGAVLSIDKHMNEKVYGSSVDATQILGGKTAMNSTVMPFINALDRVVPKKRISQR